MASDSSLVIQFISETRDNLEDAARGLLALESSALDQDLINSIFRNIHTIKGTSGIFPEFQSITSLTHMAEDLMDNVRNGNMLLAGEHVDLFLCTLDLVSAWLDSIEITGAVPSDTHSASTPLRERFQVFLERGQEHLQSAPQAATIDNSSLIALNQWLMALPEKNRLELSEVLSVGEQLCSIRYVPDENSFFFGDDPINLLRQLHDIRLLEISPGAPPGSIENYDPFVCTLTFLAVVGDNRESLEVLFGYVEDQIQLLDLQHEHLELAATIGQTPPSGVDITLVLPDAAEPDQEQSKQPCAPVDLIHKKPSAVAVLRIDQTLITRFVDLVGEIIIAKNTLPYLSRRAAEYFEVPTLAEEIEGAFSTINQIVGNLQDIALEMRMLPVSKAFERFPRLVRDISAKLGKKIILIMEGEETKADKDVIEALSEPLIHMVRNSLDHGIEGPEERVASGKTPEGTIKLRAYQDNSGIVVEIDDNGRGIDPDRIRSKAAEKGIASTEALAAMSDDSVIQLIMAPNFSTAETVSDLSGRGVGMDAVNCMVQGFGGSVRIFSAKGSGSLVRLTLPLSMAIAKLLIVRQGDSTLGIPSTDIVETLIDLPRTRITTVGSSPGLEVRGNLFPLYRLSSQLGMEGASSTSLDNFSAVVLNVRGKTVALAVDSFCDIIDVVVKPLEGIMSGIRYYSGSTILGDGTIMFVLNLPEVIVNAG